MEEVYRTCSDEQGAYEFPGSLREQFVTRAVIISADGQPDGRFDHPDGEYRSPEVPYGAYRTRTDFRRGADAWRIAFELIPTADLLAAEGNDNATYLAILRDLGLVQYFAVRCALSELTQNLSYALIDRRRLGEQQADRLANSYTFAPRRNDYDLAVRVGWTIPHDSLDPDLSFVESLSSLLASGHHTFPRPFRLRLGYLTDRR